MIATVKIVQGAGWLPEALQMISSPACSVERCSARRLSSDAWTRTAMAVVASEMGTKRRDALPEPKQKGRPNQK